MNELSDLEGLARRLINKGYSEEKILHRLVQEYLDYKDYLDETTAKKYAHAILDECIKSDIKPITDSFLKGLLDFNKANVTVGKQGVGGAGDFFVHKLIAELSETEKKAYLSPKSLDDAGEIRIQDITFFKNEKFDEGNLIVVSKMEGKHSRLSDFPFICGFHAMRACLKEN